MGLHEHEGLDHTHLHGVGGHHHFPAPDRQMSGVLKWSIGLTLALVVAELIGGVWGRAISLISDAFHNLTDVPAMALAWVALLWAHRPPSEEKTYGYHRAGILAAFTNGLLLVLVSLYIGWESFERLQRPLAVREDIMIGVALVALAINGGITLALVRGRRDLNLRGILLHNLGDALSNVAIIAGALAIHFGGWPWVDPVLGLAIAALVLWSSVGLLRESSHILLEGMPRGIKLADVAQCVLGVSGVEEVHDIHIWTLGTDLLALSCHVRIPDMHMDASERLLLEIRRRLAERFRITHSTIQFERAGLPRSSVLVMPAAAQRDG
jgi:cobalt-zinc-cadmium efflux system protein